MSLEDALRVREEKLRTKAKKLLEPEKFPSGWYLVYHDNENSQWKAKRRDTKEELEALSSQLDPEKYFRAITQKRGKNSIRKAAALGKDTQIIKKKDVDAASRQYSEKEKIKILIQSRGLNKVIEEFAPEKINQCISEGVYEDNRKREGEKYDLDCFIAAAHKEKPTTKHPDAVVSYNLEGAVELNIFLAEDPGIGRYSHPDNLNNKAMGLNKEGYIAVKFISAEDASTEYRILI